MRKKNSANAIIVIALVAVVAVVYFVVGNGDKQKGDVIAKVNGQPIYKDEVNEQLSELLKRQGAQVKADYDNLDDKAKYIVVKELAAQKLILEQAYDEGIDETENVKKRLDKVKDQIIKDEFLAQKAKPAIDDDKLKARYDELVKELEGKTQYKTSHILVKTEKEAKKVERQLKKKSFAEVAKAESIDESSASNGGDLGYLLSGQMLPEFEEKITDIKEGEISEPFETHLGWHIVKLEDKRPAKADPYEESKLRIAQNMAGNAIQDYIKNIVKDANIELIGSGDEASGENKNDEDSNS